MAPRKSMRRAQPENNTDMEIEKQLRVAREVLGSNMQLNNRKQICMADFMKCARLFGLEINDMRLGADNTAPPATEVVQFLDECLRAAQLQLLGAVCPEKVCITCIQCHSTHITPLNSILSLCSQHKYAGLCCLEGTRQAPAFVVCRGGYLDFTCLG